MAFSWRSSGGSLAGGVFSSWRTTALAYSPRNPGSLTRNRAIRWRTAVRLRAHGHPRRSQQGGLVVQDHPHRYLLEQLVEAPLCEERFHEAAVLEPGQDLRRDAAAEVDTAQRHHPEGEIPGGGAVDRHEEVERSRAHVVPPLEPFP